MEHGKPKTSSSDIRELPGAFAASIGGGGYWLRIKAFIIAYMLYHMFFWYWAGNNFHLLFENENAKIRKSSKSSHSLGHLLTEQKWSGIRWIKG